MPALVAHHGARSSTASTSLPRASCAIALDAGVEPREISFAGPGKSDAELRRRSPPASSSTSSRSARCARLGAGRRSELGAAARVAVRVNPDFELKSSGMKMGGGPKQFGVDAERVPALLARARHAAARVRGLSHLQRLAEPARRGDLRGAAEDRRARLRLARTRRRRCSCSTSAAASAFRTSPASSRSTSRRSARTCRRSPRRRRARCRRRELVIELGRYLVGEAGIYVCRVIDRKISRGQVFLSPTAACTTISPRPATSAR